MSAISLAPVDILGMWVNEVRFSIVGPIDGDFTQDISFKFGVKDVEDARSDTYQINLAVKCEVTPADADERVANAEVAVGCVVAPTGVEDGDSLDEAAKRTLLINGISFAYGEARSRIADLFEGSLAGRRVDIQPVVPATILDFFCPADDSDPVEGD